MKRPVYIVDAFTEKRFAGNQAAVVLCAEPLTNEEHQKIAAEFNLSETSFIRPLNVGEEYTKASEFELRWFTPTTEMKLCGHATLAAAHVLFSEMTSEFELRWFSPTTEIPLCGHATLAAAHVLYNEMKNDNGTLSFHTLSGELTVSRHVNGGLEMNFPAHEISLCLVKDVEDPHAGAFPEFVAPYFLPELVKSIIPDSIKVRSVAYAAKKNLIIALDEGITKDEFQSFTPDYTTMMRLHPDGSVIHGVIVTVAPKNPAAQGFVDDDGKTYDYACRYFAPWLGVLEDPATGSAQCDLGPYWAQILQKQQFNAVQTFPGRGAQFVVTVLGAGRVSLVGHSLTVVRGEIELD